MLLAVILSMMGRMVSDMMSGTFFLEPVNGRKSFGRKCLCRVLEDGRRAVLLSYNTIVATVDDGVLARHWDGWSMTTGTHIASFCRHCGVPHCDKSDWSALPVVAVPSWA